MSLTVDDGSPVTTNYLWDVNRSLPVVLQDATNTFATAEASRGGKE